jgi:hypothetical protein
MIYVYLSSIIPDREHTELQFLMEVSDGVLRYHARTDLGPDDILICMVYFHLQPMRLLEKGNVRDASKNDGHGLLNDDIMSLYNSIKNSYILFHNSWELCDLHYTPIREQTKKLVEHLELDPKRVIFSTCDYNNQHVRPSVDYPGILVFDWPLFRCKKWFDETADLISFGCQRRKRFTFLNRNNRIERLLTILFCMTNFPEQFTFSYLSKPMITLEQLKSTFPDYRRYINIDNDIELKKILSTFPLILDGSFLQVNWLDYPEVLLNHLNDSYIFLIFETNQCFTGSYQISEKTYQAIRRGMPFMLFGPPGILAHLHKIGFKTFHPHICEDYDKENDLISRLRLLFTEIRKICLLSDEEMHELYTMNLLPVVQHNINLLKHGSRELFTSCITQLLV